MLGTLLFFGVLGISGIKAAHDNYEMRKISRKADKDGNVHYMDRHCNDYINGERVQRVETTDKNGVKLYSTVGMSSGRVYDTAYGRGTRQIFEYSENNKRMAIEFGKSAYSQYNPYFETFVTTEIATGRTITCVCCYDNCKTKKRGYKKWYFRPECQGKYDWNRTVKGDYGIDITEEEYNKLNIIDRKHATIPSDFSVFEELVGWD